MGQLRPIALAIAALLALAAASVPAWADPSFPPLTGRVVDAANIIPPDEKARLDQKLAGLEAQSHRQLVVATIPDLQGYEISDYGYQLGRAWGIGSKEHNDGALLIVAPNEHKVRIEVGYGLEGVLTDGLSSLIIQNTIVPRFKAGDLPGGIEAGTDALIHQLTLPDDQARQIAAQSAQPLQQDDSSWFPGAFFLIMFFVVFILPALLRRRGGMSYRSSGVAPMILWGVLDGLASGRSISGGGNFGGGGFSGGGGSFGGGGASGNW
jgi:uncharacterized protein